MKKIFILSTSIFYFTIISFAQTKLPMFFANGMVLQRNTNAAIWGTDATNRKVIVSGSWGSTDSVITNSAGKWKLTLATPAAGGPYTLTVNGSSTVVINDILIGEVWVCSGQSNMEMPMTGYTTTTPPQTIDSSAFFIASSLNPQIRVFKCGWNGTSRIPVDDITVGSWASASPTNTPAFSATAYFFARKLQAALGVPVGAIVIARGGSSIESWMDSTTLATVKTVSIPNPVNWQTAQTTHTILYNTMLHPFIGYTMKGIIWSQGEANRSNHFEYQEMLTKTINSWRTQWNLGTFPFYVAQVAPTGGTTNQNGAFLREAQLNTTLILPSTGLATTLDIGVSNIDHYPKKKVIGDRLADWALVKTYGLNGTAGGPIVNCIAIRNDTINVKFNNTAGGLVAASSGLTDFEIAGANKVFFPATATIANDGISVNVRSANVPIPLFVNYGFKNFVVGSLFNGVGTTATSFRTENILAVLPVVFGDITATQKKGIRTVAFNTLAETNIKNFELQSSTNATEFNYLTKIDAKNRSAFYKYDDHSNTNNTNVYYRLKANNNDGTSEYSKIIKSSLFERENGIKIINPSHNGVDLVFTRAFTGSINISDNSGKTIAIKQLNNYSGNLRIALPRAYKGTAVVSFISTDNKKHTELVNIL